METNVKAQADSLLLSPAETVAPARSSPRPICCVATVIRRAGKILLHKRKGKHAAGSWACPGGHIEKWETFQDAALRETAEEAGGGIVLDGLRLWRVTNTLFPEEDRHYIVIYVVADWVAGEAEVREPEKCERWEWFAWNELPSPLVKDLQDVAAQAESPFEIGLGNNDDAGRRGRSRRFQRSRTKGKALSVAAPRCASIGTPRV
jgi:8-oxo-dGTP diphosphatase